MPNPWTGKGNPYTKQEVRDRLQAVVNQKKPLLRPVRYRDQRQIHRKRWCGSDHHLQFGQV